MFDKVLVLYYPEIAESISRHNSSCAFSSLVPSECVIAGKALVTISLIRETLIDELFCTGWRLPRSHFNICLVLVGFTG